VADQQGFKHISVSDEDDDLVIEAGARHAAPAKQAPSVARTQPVEPQAPADPAPAAAAPEDAAPSQPDASAFPGGVAPANEDEARALKEHMARKRAREKANALVTTEEDLHAKGPFLSMQRIIIAIVLVVVGVVYLAMFQ
jgi:uncharacterized membrane protein